MAFMKKLSAILKRIGGFSLLGMMLLTCSDVVGSLFGHPLLGAEEIVALWASILLAFSLPSAHLEKANVGVDLLYTKFSPFAKTVNNFCIYLISFILFSLISWQCYLYAGALQASGEVTMTLQLPAYYLVYSISFALFILSVVMLFELFILFRSGEEPCQNQ